MDQDTSAPIEIKVIKIVVKYIALHAPHLHRLLTLPIIIAVSSTSNLPQ